MTPETDRVALLLEWCQRKSILVDNRLEIRLQAEPDKVDKPPGIAVFSQAYIPPKCTVVKIPKDSVLSVRTCSLANKIPFVPYGLGAQLSLSLALYAEILEGHASTWYGYLQSFPGDADLPVFWDSCSTWDDPDLAEDSLEALLWLTGTEASKILHGSTEDGSCLLDAINRYFYEVARPLLKQRKDDVYSDLSLRGFYRAYSFVSSRAFLVDSYYGLSMVPIADAFNHIVENHIHLESDFSVCPECGSVFECSHDRDFSSNDNQTSLAQAENTDDRCFEMVTNAAVPSHSEVFNTYGETLTNAQLLNQYGFILDVNENDRVVWTIEEILPIVGPEDISDENIEALEGAYRTLASHPSVKKWLEQSDFVYDESAAESQLSLNEEGQLSTNLWALLVALYHRHILGSGDNRRELPLLPDDQLLQSLMDLHLALESAAAEDHGDEDGERDSDGVGGADPRVLGILRGLANCVVELCTVRIRNCGKSGSEDLDLSNLLDQIPEDKSRTRLALTVLISERSILDSCRARWATLGTFRE